MLPCMPGKRYEIAVYYFQMVTINSVFFAFYIPMWGMLTIW